MIIMEPGDTYEQALERRNNLRAIHDSYFPEDKVARDMQWKCRASYCPPSLPYSLSKINEFTDDEWNEAITSLPLPNECENNNMMNKVNEILDILNDISTNDYVVGRHYAKENEDRIVIEYTLLKNGKKEFKLSMEGDYSGFYNLIDIMNIEFAEILYNYFLDIVGKLPENVNEVRREWLDLFKEETLTIPKCVEVKLPEDREDFSFEEPGFKYKMQNDIVGSIIQSIIEDIELEKKLWHSPNLEELVGQVKNVGVHIMKDNPNGTLALMEVLQAAIEKREVEERVEIEEEFEYPVISNSELKYLINESYDKVFGPNSERFSVTPLNKEALFLIEEAISDALEDLRYEIHGIKNEYPIEFECDEDDEEVVLTHRHETGFPIKNLAMLIPQFNNVGENLAQEVELGIISPEIARQYEWVKEYEATKAFMDDKSAEWNLRHIESRPRRVNGVSIEYPAQLEAVHDNEGSDFDIEKVKSEIDWQVVEPSTSDEVNIPYQSTCGSAHATMINNNATLTQSGMPKPYYGQWVANDTTPTQTTNKVETTLNEIPYVEMRLKEGEKIELNVIGKGVVRIKIVR